MNKIEQLRLERENLNLVEPNNRIGSQEGSIRINSASTLNHELVKFLVCWILKKKGTKYLTEAKLKVGGRCDVLNESEGLAFEIMETETIDKLNAKDYPIPIFPVKVTFSNEFKEELNKVINEIRRLIE